MPLLAAVRIAPSSDWSWMPGQRRIDVVEQTISDHIDLDALRTPRTRIHRPGSFPVCHRPASSASIKGSTGATRPDQIVATGMTRVDPGWPGCLAWLGSVAESWKSIIFRQIGNYRPAGPLRPFRDKGSGIAGRVPAWDGEAVCFKLPDMYRVRFEFLPR